MNVLCLTPVEHIDSIVTILSSIGDVTYLPFATKEQMMQAQTEKEYGAIFVNPNMMTYRLDEETVSDSVEIVCTASTGTNHIDKEFCNLKHIKIISLTTDYDVIRKISSTAEHAFALMMAIIRNIPTAFDSVKAGSWDYLPFIGRQIDQLTIGVVGYGRLGRMMATYCEAFGAKVVVCDPYIKWCHFEKQTLEYVFSFCDVVSLHVHLNNETTGMIDKRLFDMHHNKGLYLVNTSRGGIVNEQDVIESIKNGQLLGYATDVVSDELGHIGDSPIIEASKTHNIIVTPHIGGMTKDAQEMAYRRVAKRLCEMARDK